jgi:hypothetical protein
MISLENYVVTQKVYVFRVVVSNTNTAAKAANSYWHNVGAGGTSGDVFATATVFTRT